MEEQSLPHYSVLQFSPLLDSKGGKEKKNSRLPRETFQMNIIMITKRKKMVHLGNNMIDQVHPPSADVEEETLGEEDHLSHTDRHFVPEEWMKALVDDSQGEGLHLVDQEEADLSGPEAHLIKVDEGVGEEGVAHHSLLGEDSEDPVGVQECQDLTGVDAGQDLIKSIGV